MIVIPKSRRSSFELDDTVFFIDNKPISFVKSFKYLGHIITSELTDDADIVKHYGDFIGQVNNTVCYFGKLDSFIQNKLFRSYCTLLRKRTVATVELEHKISFASLAEEFKTHMASSAAHTLLSISGTQYLAIFL